MNILTIKNLRLLLNTAFIAVFILLGTKQVVFAQDISSDSSFPYIVKSMNSDINFGSDKVSVQETFNVQFNESRHGIFRYLPLFYESNENNKHITSRLDIKVNSVKDLSNNPVNYELIPIRSSILDESDPLLGLFYNAIEIKIGDKDKTVIGEQDYVIDYTIQNFPTNPNVFVYGLSGTGWDTEIQNYSANLKFDEAPSNFACRTGIARQTSVADCNVNKIDNKNFKITSTSISSGSGVQFSAEDLTFHHQSDLLNFFLQNWYLPIPFLALIILFFYWRTQRSPKGTGVIVPQYSIPENLTPAEIGTIYDDSVDKVDISATIIDLAVKGYIKIVNKSQNEKKPDISLELSKGSDDQLKLHEQLILNSLFLNGEKNVPLSSLSAGSLASSYESVQKDIYLWGIKSGFYTKKPDKVNSFTYAVMFILAVIVPSIAFNLLSIAVAIIIGALITIPALVLFFTRQFKSYQGVLLNEKIEGLKLFIEYAKKDQLEMLQTPLQEVYEKYLPYAMVFNLHKSWTNAFKDINLTVPDWYEGYSNNNFFTNLLFINYLNNISTSLNTAYTVPSSSGSGFLGGVGGGSIGGGFSGGGGGSW